MQDDYPAQFWIAFWSEQLVKAYGFVLYSQQKNYSAAKKISYRLPFSFTKTDWKKIDQHELVRAHHFLYFYDFHIKNGGTDRMFDLFYSNFFTGFYKKTDFSGT